MKSKIVTKISKWTYLAVVIIMAPLWIILGVIDHDAFNNGIEEGLKVIKANINQIDTK